MTFAAAQAKEYVQSSAFLIRLKVLEAQEYWKLGFSEHFVGVPTMLSVSTMLVAPSCIFLFWLLLLVIAPVFGIAVSEETERRRLQNTSVAVYDTNNRWLGLIPRNSVVTSLVEPDYWALPIEDNLPEYWWKILMTLEDRNVYSIRNVNGIDVLSPFVIAYSILSGNPRGGSSLCIQVVRSIYNRPPNSSRGKLGLITRKLREIRDCTAFSNSLNRDGTFKELKFMAAAHLPIARGGRGSKLGRVIHGVNLGSRILFNKKATDINVAEQAILAALVKKPMPLSPLPDSRDDRLDHWKWAKRRAAYGLEVTFNDDPAFLKSAIAMLEKIRMPMLNDNPTLNEFKTMTNPHRRSRHFAGGALTEMIAELKTSTPIEGLLSLTSVKLTIDSKSNKEFENAVNEQLAKIDKSYSKRLSMSVEKEADVLAVVINNQSGSVERIFVNKSRSLFGTFESYQGRDARPVGSIGKIIPLIALANVYGATDMFCNKRVSGANGTYIQNYNGDQGSYNCSDAKWYSVKETISRSLSLPLLWAAFRDISQQDVISLSEHFGITPAPGVDARTSLILGMATASPKSVLGMMKELHGELFNSSTYSSELSLINERVYQQTNPRPDNADSKIKTYRNITPINHVNRPVLRETLNAPFLGNGTLSSIYSTISHHFDNFIGKTGTSDATNDGTRDKWFLFSFGKEQESYTALLLVGSPHPEYPLGHKLSGQMFAPILNLLITSID